MLRNLLYYIIYNLCLHAETFAGTQSMGNLIYWIKQEDQKGQIEEGNTMSKRKMALIFICFFMLFAFVPSANICCARQQDTAIVMMTGSAAAGVNGVKVNIDEDDKVCPSLANDRNMVPLRFIAENLGLDVLWDADKRTALLKNSETNLILNLNSQVAVVNGNEVELDSPAMIKNDRIFVPVRFIAEHFSCGVEWDRYDNKVIVKEEHPIPLYKKTLWGKIDLLNGVDDYRFASVYNNPKRSLKMYAQYKSLFTPDFLFNSNMDVWHQIESVRKSR